jgi:hypothetical protein
LEVRMGTIGHTALRALVPYASPYTQDDSTTQLYTGLQWGECIEYLNSSHVTGPNSRKTTNDD